MADSYPIKNVTPVLNLALSGMSRLFASNFLALDSAATNQFNVLSYGAKGNGVNDDSTAVIATLQAAYNAGGGTVFFPTGTYLLAQQITLPNDGSTTFNNGPLQPSIRITGAGAAGGFVPGHGSLTKFGPAYGGAVLNLTFNAPQGKIMSLGNGPLELDHLTFCDTSTDTAPFFYATNTTVNIHDCTFLGTASGPALTNDAIVLGGTSTTPSGNANAPFQGYGSIITHCWFERIRRILLGQSFCNSVFFTENTIWSACGNTQGGNGAAIELGVAAGGNAVGNVIADNLFEALAYIYLVRIINGTENKILRNDTWDGAGSFTATVRCDSGTSNTFVVGGVNAPQKGVLLSDAGTGTTTVLSSHLGDPNVFTNPVCVQLTATSSLTTGQVVKLDTSNVGAVVVCTTADTGGGLPIGICCNSPSAGQQALIAQFGKIAGASSLAPILGTGTATIGQFLIVDTTTNGRVKATSTYIAGTVIGVATTNQNTVGQPVGILLGLR